MYHGVRVLKLAVGSPAADYAIEGRYVLSNDDGPLYLRYLARIEQLAGVPIDIVSTGPDRVETIVLRHPFD